MSFDEFREVVAEMFGCEPEDVSEDTLLAEDLGADEYDLLELRWELEEGIGTALTDAQLAACETLGQVWALAQG